MSGKYKSNAPTAGDVETALKAFSEELQLEARWYVTSTRAATLRAACDVWREVNGERISIVREVKDFNPHHSSLFGIVLGCIHRAYWKAEELAHGEPNPYKLKRSNRQG